MPLPESPPLNYDAALKSVSWEKSENAWPGLIPFGDPAHTTSLPDAHPILDENLDFFDSGKDHTGNSSPLINDEPEDISFNAYQFPPSNRTPVMSNGQQFGQGTLTGGTLASGAVKTGEVSGGVSNSNPGPWSNRRPVTNAFENGMDLPKLAPPRVSELEENEEVAYDRPKRRMLDFYSSISDPMDRLENYIDQTNRLRENDPNFSSAVVKALAEINELSRVGMLL